MSTPLHPPGFVEPCLPTVSRAVPTGPEWVYEIKHDGFRFICLRHGKRVRAFSRGGHDWSEQLPAVINGIRGLPARSVTLDGEVVICASDGRSEFERMRACLSRQGAPEAFLYASDVLELDGHDLRHESWEGRRAVLVQLLANADEGIRLCEHIEDVDGAVVFRQACVMGLEGIVAKRRDSRYHSGRSRDCRIVVAGHRAYGWGGKLTATRAHHVPYSEVRGHPGASDHAPAWILLGR